MRQDDLEAAQAHLNQAMRLANHAQLFDANLNLGIIEMRQGNLDGGRAFFEAARDVMPGEPVGYINLARWYLQVGRVDSAQAILELGRERAFPLLPLEEAIDALSQGRSF